MYLLLIFEWDDGGKIGNKNKQSFQQCMNHDTKKYHVFAPMGRFQLESIYLYFPPSSQLVLYWCVLLFRFRNYKGWGVLVARWINRITSLS